MRGRADFDAISEGKAPIYAKHYAYLLDGGSEWFRGRGYSIYRMNRTLMARGNNPPEGYLGGAWLEWTLPVRVFVADDHSYHYIPDTTEQPGQGTAANRLSTLRPSVAGIRERTVRSTAAAEAVADR